MKKIIDTQLYTPILRRRARRLGDHIAQSLGECKTLLDFGCGNMVLAEYLQNNFAVAVTGVDMVDNNLTSLPLVIYSGERLPFEENSFDAVIAVFALHHCTDPEFSLGELVRVSRRKVLIIEETFRNPFEKAILFVHDWIGNHLESWDLNIPLNFLSEKSWCSLFERMALSIVKIQPVKQYSRFNLTRQLFFELEK